MMEEMKEKKGPIQENSIAILLIEDNPGDARLLQEMLKETEGASFLLVHRDRLSAGLTYLADNEVDVILLDLGLPDSQGLNTYLQLYEKSEHIPIIVLTGLKDNSLAVSAVQRGAQDYLAKEPLNSELLYRSIRYAIERKRAEHSLRASEQRYRTLFENMLNGFAYCEMLFDDQDRPVDFRYLSVNKAFERLTGLKEVVGKYITEVIPGIRELSPEVFEIYGRVARTGYPEQFTFDFKALDMWLSIAVYSMEQGYFVAVFDDITERKRIENEREQSIYKLRKSLRATVQAIAAVVEARDPYTAGHQRRSADLARAIATEMGFSSDRTDFIRIAATIHDIGKIAVPAEILSKPTKLSDIEFDLIRTHSQSGYDILKDVEFPWQIADVILQHHERMDGSGYPQGLQGDDILMEARILAVADVVESMASHRPYRPALGIDAALVEIEKYKGTLYDPAVVDSCLSLFRKKRFQLQEI